MKTSRVLLIIFLIIIFNQAYGKKIDSVNVVPKIILSNEYALIRLSIEFNDTSKSEKEWMHESYEVLQNKKSIKPDIDVSQACEELFSQIKKTNGIEIYIERPKYLDEIINLIPTKADRIKAVEIYNNEYYKSAISASTSQSVVRYKGSWIKELIIDFNIPLKIKSNTT